MSLRGQVTTNRAPASWPFATASWWLNVALLRSSLGHFGRCDAMSFSVNRPTKPTAVQNDIERRAKLIDETLVQMLSMMDEERARAFAEEYTAIIMGKDRPEHLASMEKALQRASAIRVASRAR